MMPYSLASDVGAMLNMSFTDTSKPTAGQVAVYIAQADNFIDKFSGHDWLQHTATQEYYDGVGYGPRAGIIMLKNPPVLAVSLVEFWDGTQWQTGVEGKQSLTPTKECYEVYLDDGKIQFYKLRLDGMKVYRVTYTYGYASLPTFVQDLSATLTALAVIAFLSGPVMASYFLGDLRVQYPSEGPYGLQWKFLTEKATRLMLQLSVRRPLVATG
jgi:hypothetical protein